MVNFAITSRASEIYTWEVVFSGLLVTLPRKDGRLRVGYVDYRRSISEGDEMIRRRYTAKGSRWFHETILTLLQCIAYGSSQVWKSYWQSWWEEKIFITLDKYTQLA